jgi:uncharacterized membrane protein
MSRRAGAVASHERHVAELLRCGTWLASAVIAMGLSLELAHMAMLGLSGPAMVKTGVGLFILLPVARVMLMLLLFLCERDYVFAILSVLVLTIIGAGSLLIR